MAAQELPKAYDPSSVESEAYRVWLENGDFHADPADPGAPYSIVIPPPNVTGALHLGHAINNTLQDILIRMHRMKGFNPVWIPGIDHAGIATQAVVEKQLKEKENKTRHDIGREALVERIWAWKEQYGNRILEQLKRLGASCDWSRTRFTLDDQCARAVRETFFKLFKDGLIYRGKRLVNWDVFLQTSVSDDEIYHETVKTNLWHLRYPIEPSADSADGADSSAKSAQSADRPKYMVVATTRPETMLGDTAVAVHPDDPRWNWAIGKHVRLPLVNRLIPIIGDPILVDPKFGTGCVKVTPAHDPNDYAVWQRHKGQADEIDIINILNPDGTLNENAGPYKGMQREVARKKVVADLEHQGLLDKVQPYETEVGHSDRSKTPIEPYLSDQWFVKMAPLAEPALEVVREQIVRFFPERYAKTYLDWLGEKRDWPISRQLWWGHRIPVWRLSEDIRTPLDRAFWDRVAGLKKWIEDGRVVARVGSDIIPADADLGEYVCLGGEWLDFSVCIRDSNDLDVVNAIESFGFVQDPDVLDTWFSSALWPHSTLGWPEDSADLRKWYPTSVLVTSRDIITLWVARMVMTGIYNMGHGQFLADSQQEAQSKIRNQKSEIRNSVPFPHVHIHPTILDGKGERMSKSKGNGVDPVEIIDSHGADALRFALTAMATETQDVRLPIKKDAQGRNSSEKFDQGRNFCNKLWNAARYALANLEEKGRRHEGTEARREGQGKQEASGAVTPANAPAPLSPDASPTPSCLRASVPSCLPSEVPSSLSDRWILSRLARTLDEIETALATYRFDAYARACYDFFWRDFCDWYVEAAKPAMKDPARSGAVAAVLSAALDASLRLMHPMIPFITETIWWKLNDARPARSLPGKLDLPPSERLIKAAWPKADRALVDESAERDFALLQEIIAAVRNVRNEYKVETRKAVDVSIVCACEASAVLHANREMLELLGTCQLKDARADLPMPAGAVRALAAGCELYLEGLVDAEAERMRLAKRKEELTKQIAALQKRLSTPSYTEKAPAHLVQQTRDQLATAEAELAKL